MKRLYSYIRSKEKIIALWTIAVLVNLKSVFTDFGTDQAYAVATSYRHLSGDALFKEMCEPHQTSAFLADFLMWIYRMFVPDLEGVVVFLQIGGVALFAGITWLLYRELIHKVPNEIAHYICLLFFVLRPKQSVFPEFSNMMIAFSVLLFVFLLKYFDNPNKCYNLVFAAICLCLGVLSYPTFAICFVGVEILLYKLCDTKRKAMILFGATSAIGGVIYLGYFLKNVGMTSLWDSLHFIVSGDMTHGEQIDLLRYSRGFVNALIWVISVFAISYVIRYLSKKKVNWLNWFLSILFLTNLLMLFVSRKMNLDWNYSVNILLLLLLGIGIRGVQYLNSQQQVMYYTGVIISVCCVVAVMCLTNLEFLSVLGYMILGLMVSVLPIYEMFKRKDSNRRKAQFCFAVILLFFLSHRLLAVCGYANEAGIKLSIDLENYVRVGPAKGVVTSLQKCNEIKGTKADWEMNINDDVVYVVVPWMLDPLVYVEPKTKIGTYSTINTVTYGESILEYWEKNPHKKPTVIAVKSWNNQIDVGENTWILKWINENYPNYEEGQYWRFYR